jgi:hypothetical protein
MDSKQAADFLVGLPESEFVLHGSPHWLTMLEPRQAHCGSGVPANNLNAIYASIVVECALFKALVRGENDNWGWRFYDEDDGDQTAFVVQGEGLRLEHGYIYVLPCERFTRVEGTLWWVAFEPVTPTLRIRVEPNILGHFSGVFFESGVSV